MTELVFLAGLLLSQTLSNSEGNLNAVPVGVLDVYGQAHVLRFEDQSPAQALGSVEAALMMHARDASRYGLVEPSYLSSKAARSHHLHVSERGSVGDLSIHFSIEQIDGQATFKHFEVEVRGEVLSGGDYKRLLSELRRGYRSQAPDQGSVRPILPESPLSLKLMI